MRWLAVALHIGLLGLPGKLSEVNPIFYHAGKHHGSGAGQPAWKRRYSK